MTKPSSPLFRSIFGNQGHQLRVKYSSPVVEDNQGHQLQAAYTNQGPDAKPLTASVGNPLTISLSSIWAKDAEPIASVEAAEDYIIASVREKGTATFDLMSNDQTVDVRLTGLTIMISRQCNIIAARTRRGAGNVVLLHPRVTQLLKQAAVGRCLSPDSDPELESEKLGRWRQAGMINSSITVYESEEMDPDGLLVAYIGATTQDAPAFLFQREDGLGLLLMQDDEGALGNAFDYFGYIKLENV